MSVLLTNKTELLSIYNELDKEDLELEIRFKRVSMQVFKELYEELLKHSDGPASISCSLNSIETHFINNEQVSRMRRITWRDDADNTKSFPYNDYIRKQSYQNKSLTVNDKLPYSINLSKETIIGPFKLGNVIHTRAKVRISFLVDEWRFDLTLVMESGIKKADYWLPVINLMKDKKLTPENFFEYAMSKVAFNKFEVEIEHITDSPVSPEDIEDIIKKTHSMISPHLLQKSMHSRILTRLGQMMGLSIKSPSFKQITNQAVALDKLTYREVYNGKYYITPKMDGERVLAELNNFNINLITNIGVESFTLGESSNRGIIADCELMADGNLYIFDLLKNHILLFKEPFNRRLKDMEEVAEILKPYLVGKAVNNVAIKDVVAKGYEVFVPEKKLIKRLLATTENDGLIFTSMDKNYRQTLNYKWKPFSQNTIDFLAIKVSEKGLKKNKYMLVCGITADMMHKLNIVPYEELEGLGEDYRPVQFSPSIAPYDHYLETDNPDLNMKIIEVRKDKAFANCPTEWVYVKTRDDRNISSNYFGNDHRVAELIYYNYVNPFTEEDLWTREDIYFEKTAKSDYNAQRRYNRRVIDELFKQYANEGEWLADLACGRGADLTRYMRMGVKNLLLSDIDIYALSEVVRRKYSLKGANNSSYYISRLDLGANYKENLRLIKCSTGEKLPTCDNIVCNFAIHYLCDGRKKLENFFKLCEKLTAKGSKVMITTFNGEKVFELLEDGDFKIVENGEIKYKIEKKYTGEKLEKYGQMISVYLPFQDRMVDEPLCNFEEVKVVAADNGFEVEAEGGFGDINPMLISSADKRYTDLYGYLIFKKK